MKSHYRDLFDLHDRVAIVTGSLGILGKGFCRALAEFGADVAVVDLDGAACAEFAADLEHEHGRSAVGIGCDVADPAAVEDMVAHVIDELGEFVKPS